MKFSDFVQEVRRYNPAITQTQARQVYDSFLPFSIQEAIEERIALLNRASLGLNGDPYGSDSRVRSQFQHWVVYNGSDYPEDQLSPEPGGKFQSLRDLEFNQYVEVEDLRRNYERALLLHELLISILANFYPELSGVRGALRLTSDGVISARSDGEVVYRYRATYKIRCIWRPADVPGLIGVDPDSLIPFTPAGVDIGLFRSPIEQIGEPEVSPKFAEIQIKAEEPPST